MSSYCRKPYILSDCFYPRIYILLRAMAAQYIPEKPAVCSVDIGQKEPQVISFGSRSGVFLQQ